MYAHPTHTYSHALHAHCRERSCIARAPSRGVKAARDIVRVLRRRNPVHSQLALCTHSKTQDVLYMYEAHCPCKCMLGSSRHACESTTVYMYTYKGCACTNNYMHMHVHVHTTCASHMSHAFHTCLFVKLPLGGTDVDLD